MEEKPLVLHFEPSATSQPRLLYKKILQVMVLRNLIVSFFQIDQVKLLAVQNSRLACILNWNWGWYTVEKLPEEFKLFISHGLSAPKGCQSYYYCRKY
jgi:hypothetical protein